ncbi:hypothetical protein D9V29_13625 [Mycetocola manganoxydans]|uniref:Exo-alpha-sialidase n=1 Tax=Mycetocola manganoxydans TaxID=699879 RepID=A0A3L6ZKK9_9MICO|nr:sialidase family protein [Mycetocola manganoxydans]RLP68516.1 hypothetical protein D9V29_13625 [Mycetocola manganoxydans]GHD51998.1 hypothetical protein GCM10008097_27380 [Mycetocola manganoxydans]
MNDRLQRKRRGTVALALLGAAVVLVGCATVPEDDGTEAPASAPGAFQHIHSLMVDPERGDLLVGTHEGLYELTFDGSGTATAKGPIGGLDFDPMGFTMRDDIAYASGHPGPTTPASFGTPNLGLIKSTDRGETWSNISLTGQTDFHDLALGAQATDGGEGTIFGLDTSKQALQRSFDGGATWSDGAELVARDLTADPATPGTVYATTENGFAVSIDDGASFTADTEAPPLFLASIDSGTGAFAGVDTSGTAWVRDASGTWVSGGTVSGTPQALTISGDRLFVADDRGIAFTDDIGVSWTILKVT